MRKAKAQVILETALVLIAVAIFILGIMRVWSWFARQYRDRWQAYNSGRLAAGKVNTYSAAGSGFVPGNYTKETLNLFP